MQSPQTASVIYEITVPGHSQTFVAYSNISNGTATNAVVRLLDTVLRDAQAWLNHMARSPAADQDPRSKASAVGEPRRCSIIATVQVNAYTNIYESEIATTGTPFRAVSGQLAAATCDLRNWVWSLNDTEQ